MGDMAIGDITRDHAREYLSWWVDRVVHGDATGRHYSPNTANRRIGDMRKLYSDYYLHMGQEDRPNPFRRLYIREKKKPPQPAYEDKWVRNKILIPGALNGIAEDIVYPILMMIETGCRPSEIINLHPEDTVLDHPVPQSALQRGKIGKRKPMIPFAKYPSSAYPWKPPNARPTASRTITTEAALFRPRQAQPSAAASFSPLKTM